jgi:hypothetical protein
MPGYLGRRRRTAALALGAVGLTVVLAAVALWPPTQPSPPPTTTGSPPVPTSQPQPTPLGGATDQDQLPDCGPEVQPAAVEPTAKVPLASGAVDLEIVGQLGGPARAALIDGNTMYVGAGDRVVTVDISDAGRPAAVATSSSLAGTVEGLAMAGELLVAAHGGGVAVLDPASAAVRSSMKLPGIAQDVAVSGSAAYVADGPGGLRIVDLADPGRPIEAGAVLDLHNITGVAVDGNLAYLAAADEGLVIVDVSDPTQPREIGRLFTGGFAFAVDIVPSSGRVLLADGWGGLRVIDVADGSHPTIESTLPSEGWSMDVELSGQRAYLADGGALRLIDLTNPANAHETGRATIRAGHVIAVTVADQLAAVVDDLAGIRLFALTEQELVSQGLFAPLSPAGGIAVYGDRAYIAAKGQGLKVVDIADPTHPTELPGVSTADPVHGVAVAGANVLFSTFPHGEAGSVASLFAADASTSGPLDPGRPAGGTLGPAYAVRGTSTYVASELVVLIYDSSGATPCLLGSIITKDFAGAGFEANGITLYGDYAYVADFYAQIHVIDISDPRHPVIVEGPADRGQVGVGKTLAYGDRLYALGDDGSGPVAAIYGLEDPLRPELLGWVGLPAETARGDEVGPQMAFGGGYLLVADGDAGLVVVDVSDPSNPAIAGRAALPGKAVAVAAVDDRAYVASDGGGLFIVEWSPAAAPPAASSAARVAPARGWLQAPPSAQAPSCTVTSTANTGPGTLRKCLSPSTEALIVFDSGVFPKDRPATITFEGGGVTVPAGVTVDASGAGVIIDGGERLGTGFDLHGAATVRGLIITGFTESAVHVEGTGNIVDHNVISANGEQGIAIWGDWNRVVGNLIGLDPTGTELWGAQKIGVIVLGKSNIIGGPEPTDRNVISGNVIDVDIKATSDNVVQGNYIGTDATGKMVRRGPEDPRAFMIEAGSTRNLVVGNVVAGDVHVIDPGTSYNAIVGNRVGVGAAGRPLESGGAILAEEPFNQVGGTMPGEGNLVNGLVSAAGDVVVLGNRIGVDAEGNALGSGRIFVVGQRAIVGGRWPAAANQVAGAQTTLIEVRSDFSLVLGNRLTLTRSGLPEVDAESIAIQVAYADNNHVVANQIDAQVGVGIRLDAGAISSVVRANVIKGDGVGVNGGTESELNVIAGNSFETAGQQASDEGLNNNWDDGLRGNWWAGFDAVDADGDGILDQARTVGPAGIDRFPLAEPP